MAEFGEFAGPPNELVSEYQILARVRYKNLEFLNFFDLGHEQAPLTASLSTPQENDQGKRNVGSLAQPGGMFAQIGFGLGDDLRDSLGLNRWIDQSNVRHAKHSGYGSHVSNEITIEFFVKRRVDCVLCGRQEKRIAIRCGAVQPLRLRCCQQHPGRFSTKNCSRSHSEWRAVYRCLWSRFAGFFPAHCFVSSRQVSARRCNPEDFT